jgi:hypothetical protein
LGRALAKGKKLLNKQFIEKYHFGWDQAVYHVYLVCKN